jgi:hypothetical protein
MTETDKFGDIFRGPRQTTDGTWDKPLVFDDKSLPSEDDAARFNVPVAESAVEEARAKAAAKAARTRAAYGGAPSLDDATPPWIDHDVEPVEEWAPSRSRGKKIMLGTAAVLASVAVAFAVIQVPWSGNEEVVPTSENPLASAQEQADNAAPTTPPPLMVNPVRDGEFAFIVNGVQPNELIVSNPNTGQSKSATGKFFAVTMTVKNEGAQPKPFDLTAQQIIGVSGTTYDLDTEGTTILNGTPPAPAPLNPDQEVRATALFDIPNNDVPAMLYLHETAGSYGTTIKFTG